MEKTRRVMISQTVEYALRAIVTIAQRGGERCSSQSIAESTQIPLPYLSKVMQQLVRGGLVDSRRGLHGGFALVNEPSELSILDVINAVDPIVRITACPLGIQSHGGSLCPLHHRLDMAMEATEDVFRQTKVSELLAEEDRPTPLCESHTTVTIDPFADGETKDGRAATKKSRKKKRAN